MFFFILVFKYIPQLIQWLQFVLLKKYNVLCISIYLYLAAIRCILVPEVHVGTLRQADEVVDELDDSVVVVAMVS